MADVEAKTCALVKIVEFHETLEDVFLLVEGNADTGVCDWERNRFCILVCLGTDGYAAFLGIFYGVGKEVYQYLADTLRVGGNGKVVVELFVENHGYVLLRPVDNRL